MALINNTIIEIQPISTIKIPQNRVIVIREGEITIRISEVTSPDITEAVATWENNVWQPYLLFYIVNFILIKKKQINKNDLCYIKDKK